MQQSDIQKAIESAEKKSKSGDMKFWIISSIWALVIIFLALAFRSMVNDLKTMKTMNIELTNQMQDLKEASVSRQEELTDLKMRLDELHASLLQELDQQSRAVKAEEIVQRQISRKYVSEGEKQFLLNEAVKELTPGSADGFFIKGSELLANSEYGAALEMLSKAHQIAPNRADVLLARGKAFHFLEEYDRAIDDFSIGLEIEPNSAPLFAARGFAYLKKESYKLALMDCNRAIEIDPKYWVPRNYAGFVYLKVGRPDKAIPEWELAAKYRLGISYKASSLENIGFAHLAMGDMKAVIENCGRVNSMDDTLPWNWLIFHIAASELGIEDLAKQSLKKWYEYRTEYDAASIAFYLPAEFHHYLK